MKNMTVDIAGKSYRMGYTTGSCAAAAAKAAAYMLVKNKIINKICIDTPIGVELILEVINAEIGNGYSVCAVVKDGGDDSDVTTGLEIYAKAEYCECKGVNVVAGIGIGTVTKKGLKVSVGEPAINPEPMKMIIKEVSEIIAEGIKITLTIPQGEETAKMTFNPKLGIVGGISIIGTTGIVTPMSEEAWKESVLLELKMCLASGDKSICFVFGNMGEKFCTDVLNIEKSKIVSISNFVGYMLDSAVNLGVENILFVGHMGKIVKVASGIFNTHSKVADGRMEALCAYAALNGATTETVNKIYNCVTTDGAEEVINEYNLQSVYSMVAEKAETKCCQRVYNKINIGCVLFNKNNKILSKSSNVEKIIQILESF